MFGLKKTSMAAVAKLIEKYSFQKGQNIRRLDYGVPSFNSLPNCCGIYELGGFGRIDNLSSARLAYFLYLFRKRCQDINAGVVVVGVGIYHKKEKLHIALERLKLQPVAIGKNWQHHGRNKTALYILHGGIPK